MAGVAADERMAVEYAVRVPRDSTRYLLLFAELHDNSGAGKKTAIKDAATFDAQRDMGGVLRGIARKIYPKILNWDLKR